VTAAQWRWLQLNAFQRLATGFAGESGPPPEAVARQRKEDSETLGVVDRNR
jgi:hypothetical protein